MGTTKQIFSRGVDEIDMTHKIQIKYVSYENNPFRIGKLRTFHISYYFRELNMWVHKKEDIEDVVPRLKGKLSKGPRRSGIYG